MMPRFAACTRETYKHRANSFLLDCPQAVHNCFFVVDRPVRAHAAPMDNVNLPQEQMPETADEVAAAIFSECIYTQVRTAAMLLGKVKAPATGEAVTDLPRVQLVIQQLEMLDKNAAKLSINEQQMLKQSLQQLRMEYVTHAGQTPEEAEAAEESSEDAPAEPTAEVAPSEPVVEDDDDDEEETGRKRFVKKYD